MAFGTATPVFYGILVVVFLTGLASALGLNVVVSFVLGFIVSYLLFIGSVSGFRDSSAIALAAGWGVLVMMPAGAGLAISALAGYFIHRLGTRKNKDDTQ
jgi:hypothetical protein